MQVVLRAQAHEDIEALHAFYAEHSVLAATRLIQSILVAVSRLRHFPALGKLGAGKGTRELVVHKRFVVVYRIDANREFVDVIAVFHHARNDRSVTF